MKFCRILNEGSPVWGIVDDSEIKLIDKAPWEAWEETAVSVKLDESELLAPVEPTNIVGIAKNYTSNFKPGEAFPAAPILFWKGLGTLANPGAAIALPGFSNKVFIEGELVVVIGKDAKDVSVEEAGDYIFGYTCSNDLTALDMLENGSKWVEAKSADGFLPVGPLLVTEVAPDAALKTKLNGETVQSTDISQLVFGVKELVAYVSSIITLKAGDIISTGSPAGRKIISGDSVEISIDGLGTLKNNFV